MAQKDFQKEMTKLVEQLKKNFQTFSKDAGVFAKKSEKEIVKASHMGRLQLDIMALNLQKEKLYYDIGKKVASFRGKKEGLEASVKPYLAKLRNIETEVRSKKREIGSTKKQTSKK